MNSVAATAFWVPELPVLVCFQEKPNNENFSWNFGFCFSLLFSIGNHVTIIYLFI